jgi:hypothetical protein
MIPAAGLGALAIELLPPQAITGQATFLGIVLVSLVCAFLPVPMSFYVAIAYIATTHGAPLPYINAALCTLGILSVLCLGRGQNYLVARQRCSLCDRGCSWHCRGLSIQSLLAKPYPGLP